MPEVVLGQVPGVTVKVEPTVDVSLNDGITVGADGGKKPETAAVVTVAVSVTPIAATMTRI